jgi:hypothetical protein
MLAKVHSQVAKTITRTRTEAFFSALEAIVGLIALCLVPIFGGIEFTVWSVLENPDFCLAWKRRGLLPDVYKNDKTLSRVSVRFK